MIGSGLLGGPSYYDKDRGIAVVERLGEIFELSMIIGGFAQHDEFKSLGDVLFGHVPVSTFVGSLATPLRLIATTSNWHRADRR